MKSWYSRSGRIRARYPELIALLAKQDTHRVLEATLSQRQADLASEAPARVIQQQRRLSPEAVAELIRQYTDGSSVATLANAFKIHRTSVLQHLTRHDVPCRRPLRSMTDIMVKRGRDLLPRGRFFKRCGLSLWRQLPKHFAESSRRPTFLSVLGRVGHYIESP